MNSTIILINLPKSLIQFLRPKWTSIWREVYKGKTNSKNWMRDFSENARDFIYSFYLFDIWKINIVHGAEQMFVLTFVIIIEVLTNVLTYFFAFLLANCKAHVLLDFYSLLRASRRSRFRFANYIGSNVMTIDYIFVFFHSVEHDRGVSSIWRIFRYYFNWAQYICRWKKINNNWSLLKLRDEKMWKVIYVENHE